MKVTRASLWRICLLPPGIERRVIFVVGNIYAREPCLSECALSFMRLSI